MTHPDGGYKVFSRQIEMADCKLLPHENPEMPVQPRRIEYG